MFTEARLDDRNHKGRKLAAPRMAPRNSSHGTVPVQTRHPWRPGPSRGKGSPRFGIHHEDAEGDGDFDDPDDDEELYQYDVYYQSAEDGEDAEECEEEHSGAGSESMPYEHDWEAL